MNLYNYNSNKLNNFKQSANILDIDNIGLIKKIDDYNPNNIKTFAEQLVQKAQGADWNKQYEEQFKKEMDVEFEKNEKEKEIERKQNQGLFDNFYDFLNSLLNGKYNTYLYILFGLYIANTILKIIK